jgi:hypothetical protein
VPEPPALSSPAITSTVPVPNVEVERLPPTQVGGGAVVDETARSQSSPAAGRTATAVHQLGEGARMVKNPGVAGTDCETPLARAT